MLQEISSNTYSYLFKAVTVSSGQWQYLHFYIYDCVEDVPAGLKHVTYMSERLQETCFPSADSMCVVNMVMNLHVLVGIF
jgi:hypothetical protein